MGFKEFRDGEGKKYLPIIVVACAIFVICILFFFLVFRFDAVRAGFGMLVKVLMPFVYGIVFAYLLYPMCEFFQRHFDPFFLRHSKNERRAKGISNACAVTLSMAIVLAAVFLLLTLVLQSVLGNVMELVMTLPQKADTLEQWLETIFAGNEVALNYVHSASDTLTNWLSELLSGRVMPQLQDILSGVTSSAMALLTKFFNLIIGIIVAVYLLMSRHQCRSQLKMVLCSIFRGRARDEMIKEVHFIDRTFTDYISGRILDSVIVGLIVYVGCLAMGIPSAPLIGVLNGVTNIIPYFGPFIGAIPAGILIFADSPIKCLWFILFILVLQQVDGNIICPKILSSKVGLSSLWVLFSTLLFGGIFGIVGMVIGVPVFVILYDLLKRLIYFGLRRNGNQEMIDRYEARFHPPHAPKETKRRPRLRKDNTADTPAKK